MFKLIILLTSFFIISTCIAQDDYTNPDLAPKKNKGIKLKEKPSDAKNPNFYKGRYMFDFNLGTPNLTTFLLKVLIEDNIKSSVMKANGLGPYVIRGEYFTRNKRSVGIDFSYANSFFAWTQIDTSYVTQYNNGIAVGNTMVIRKNDYTMNASRLRIVPRATFHFYGKNNPRIDPYLTIGMGWARFKTTGSPRVPQNIIVALGGLFRNGDGIVFLGKFGMRYQISEKVGINGEIGIGGPFLSFGGYVIF